MRGSVFRKECARAAPGRTACSVNELVSKKLNSQSVFGFSPRRRVPKEPARAVPGSHGALGQRDRFEETILLTALELTAPQHITKLNANAPFRLARVLSHHVRSALTPSYMAHEPREMSQSLLLHTQAHVSDPHVSPHHPRCRSRTQNRCRARVNLSAFASQSRHGRRPRFKPPSPTGNQSKGLVTVQLLTDVTAHSFIIVRVLVT